MLGYEEANKRLKGVFLLTGLPGSGKTMLSRYFIAHNLSKRRASIYVSTDEPPSSVEYSLKKFGYKPKRHDLRIVDCYSWKVGIDLDPRFQAVAPFNLTEVEITVSKVWQGLRNFSFVLDSASTLMLNAGIPAATNFLQTLSAHIRQAEGLGLVLLESGIHGRSTLYTLGAMLDGILQIKLEELPSGRLMRFFRAYSMKNSSHHSDWMPFEIHGDGIYFTAVKLDETEHALGGHPSGLPISRDADYEKNPFEKVLKLPRRGLPILPTF